MNINDFVAKQVVNHLKDRDDYVAILEKEIRDHINRGNIKNMFICARCDKLGIPGEYLVNCGNLNCRNTYCKECSSTLNNYYYQFADGTPHDTHYCVCECCIDKLDKKYQQERYRVK